MKLLVLGANSQLGKELEALLETQGVDYQSVDIRDVDLLKKQEVIKLISRSNPDQIINVASYTNLLKAETDPEAANLCDVINAQGVSILAEVCQQLDIPLIHQSTSYVFDGQKLRPYEEDEKTNPVSRYGQSRWYGERSIRETHDKHIILRTDWMFSRHRHRFFKAHIDACKANKGKTEVMNHRFSPTPAEDVARVILAIARQVDCAAEVWGTYHYSSLQPMSEEHFVETILKEASQYDDELAKLDDKFEITINEVEPPYIPNTTVNSQKIMETFGIKQRSRAAAVTYLLKSLYGKLPEEPDNNSRKEKDTDKAVPEKAVSEKTVKSKNQNKKKPSKKNSPSKAD